jgi:four helix bundle protein
MTANNTQRAAIPGDVRLDVERLDVYQLALEFQALVSGCRLSRDLALKGQLERATSSILLNLAEGSGRRQRGDKARFYGIARGSAMECAAAFDVLRIRRMATDAECVAARGLLIRIVQMLSKLEASVLSREVR